MDFQHTALIGQRTRPGVQEFPGPKQKIWSLMSRTHFINKKFPMDATSGRDEILNIFQRDYRNVTLQKIISQPYSALQNLQTSYFGYIEKMGNKVTLLEGDRLEKHDLILSFSSTKDQLFKSDRFVEILWEYLSKSFSYFLELSLCGSMLERGSWGPGGSF